MSSHSSPDESNESTKSSHSSPDESNVSKVESCRVMMTRLDSTISGMDLQLSNAVSHVFLRGLVILKTLIEFWKVFKSKAVFQK